MNPRIIINLRRGSMHRREATKYIETKRAAYYTKIMLITQS